MFIQTEERITAAYIFYSWTKNNSNNRYTSIKFEQPELAKSCAMPSCLRSWSMCKCGLRANVLVCQRDLHANVAKAFQLLIFTFQRVIRLAIFFLSWRANVPIRVPSFSNISISKWSGKFLYFIMIQKILHFIWYHSYHTYHMCINRK